MASTTPSPTTSNARSCSLGVTERTDRMGAWHALRSDALIDEHATDEMTVVVLKRSEDVMRRLRELIEAERDCCSFLRFQVGEEEDRIVVRVTSSGSRGVA